VLFLVDIKYYLKDVVVDDCEKLLLEELIEFLDSEDVDVDLSTVMKKIDGLVQKLNPSFVSLLYKKIELIKKNKELDLMFSFLFDNFKSYRELYNKTGLDVQKIKDIINRYGFGYENTRLEDRLDEFDRMEKDYRIKKFKLYDEFLWVYLNSRYYTSFIKKVTGVSPSEFLKHIVVESMKDNYPEDINEIIESKIEVLTRLKVSRVSDLIPIRDMEVVKIVRDDLYKVSSSDYKRLEVVLDYLKSYGNVEKMDKNYRYNPVLVYSILDRVLNANLLKEDVSKRIKKYKDVYSSMSLLSVKQKMSLVKSMLINYYTYNGNIVKLIEIEGNPEVVLRLLNDDIANGFLGDREYEKILHSIKMYSDKEEVIKIIKKIKEPIVVDSDK